MSKKFISGVAIVGLLVIAVDAFGQAKGGGRRGRRRFETVAIDAKTLPRDDGAKKIVDVLADMHENQRRGMQNVSPDDGRLLRVLTESIGAKHVVEIGTSNGYSALWFCLALRATGGKLITHEIDPKRAAMARENFKRAGADQLVTIVEGDAHKTVTKSEEPIDILFLDADKPGYVDYLNKLLPLVRPGGLVIAHNMRRPAPDPNYVKAITTNPKLETILLHMEAAGIGVTMKKRQRRLERDLPPRLLPQEADPGPKYAPY